MANGHSEQSTRDAKLSAKIDEGVYVWRGPADLGLCY